MIGFPLRAAVHYWFRFRAQGVPVCAGGSRLLEAETRFSRRISNAETYIPAKQPPPCKNARLSRSHEDRGRSCGIGSPPCEGPSQVDRERRAQRSRRSLICLVPEDPLSLPRSSRVLQSSEFRKVYQSGARMTSRYFVAFCLREESAASVISQPRFGFTVPRAVGKAVVRNRIKRRMREAVRTHLHTAPANCIFVFNPRRSALDAPFDELCRETGRIFSKISESQCSTS